MKKINILMLMTILLFFWGSSFAQKTKDTTVTSTINNEDQNFQPFRIQSDNLNLGVYRNGADSVFSRIQAIGDWELDMLSSSVRRVSINFGDPVNPSDPINGAPPSANYPVRFLAQCPASLISLVAGLSQSCKMVVAVNVGSNRYSIRFGYVAGTTPASWTCNSAANGKCNGWRMTSNTDGTGKIAAQLYQVTTVRNKETLVERGKYYFSFDVGVTNP